MGFPALAPRPPAEKRAALRAGLASGRLLRMPGAFSACPTSASPP
jgi:hypothetical protein